MNTRIVMPPKRNFSDNSESDLKLLEKQMQKRKKNTNSNFKDISEAKNSNFLLDATQNITKRFNSKFNSNSKIKNETQTLKTIEKPQLSNSFINQQSQKENSHQNAETAHASHVQQKQVYNVPIHRKDVVIAGSIQSKQHESRHGKNEDVQNDYIQRWLKTSASIRKNVLSKTSATLTSNQNIISSTGEKIQILHDEPYEKSSFIQSTQSPTVAKCSTSTVASNYQNTYTTSSGRIEVLYVEPYDQGMNPKIFVIHLNY